MLWRATPPRCCHLHGKSRTPPPPRPRPTPPGGPPQTLPFTIVHLHPGSRGVLVGFRPPVPPWKPRLSNLISDSKVKIKMERSGVAVGSGVWGGGEGNVAEREGRGTRTSGAQVESGGDASAGTKRHFMQMSLEFTRVASVCSRGCWFPPPCICKVMRGDKRSSSAFQRCVVHIMVFCQIDCTHNGKHRLFQSCSCLVKQECMFGELLLWKTRFFSCLSFYHYWHAR